MPIYARSGRLGHALRGNAQTFPVLAVNGRRRSFIPDDVSAFDAAIAAAPLARDVGGALANRCGMIVVADDPDFVDDPTGDSLDAPLCAVHAAWAWRNRGRIFNGPRAGIDLREGWIADPDAVEQPEDGA